MKLIGAPYTPPAVRRGDWLDDERYGAVEVGGWTSAPIVWPRRKKTGRHSPILFGDLVRAVRTESVEAICHYWGVGQTTVWAWRQALGVDTTEGSRRIARRGVPADAAAKGRAVARSEESRAKIAASKRGKSAHPNTRAALLKAAKAPKPPGWGKMANEWMMQGKMIKRHNLPDAE